MERPSSTICVKVSKYNSLNRLAWRDFSVQVCVCAGGGVSCTSQPLVLSLRSSYLRSDLSWNLLLGGRVCLFACLTRHRRKTERATLEAPTKCIFADHPAYIFKVAGIRIRLAATLGSLFSIQGKTSTVHSHDTIAMCALVVGLFRPVVLRSLTPRRPQETLTPATKRLLRVTHDRILLAMSVIVDPHLLVRIYTVRFPHGGLRRARASPLNSALVQGILLPFLEGRRRIGCTAHGFIAREGLISVQKGMNPVVDGAINERCAVAACRGG